VAKDKSILDMIGNTPMMKLSRMAKADNAEVWVKLEGFNPGGSVKDRIALSMVEDAELRGRLRKGMKIVEPTSGNTGIGLAMVAAVKGYPIILTMPESMSMERRQLLQAYGAELVLTPAAKGMRGALDKAGEIAAVKREIVVEAEKKRVEDHAPIRIEAPVREIQKSERVIKEKQAPLFEHLPDTPLPPVKLLDEAAHDGEQVSTETLEFTSRLIEKKLSDFGVSAKVLAAYPGPVITRYEIEPAVGVKGSQIVNLVKDLARALSVVSIRVVETIPGKSCMGLEIPNPHRQTVRLSEILGSEHYAGMHTPLALALGKDIAGNPVVVDLQKMPHLLVAGTTGSGKSVAINAMILSLLYKSEPKQVRLIMVDPKMLELSMYQDIPHLLAPVVTDMKQAANALTWCVAEMERRYKLMSWVGVRNLSGFNHKVAEAERTGRPLEDPATLESGAPQPLTQMPYIVVVIDELADLMMVVGKKVEELIARLAQKARASGIHLILATQRPSVDVITGLIKANIPSRIAFAMTSGVDSRTILDATGAEDLLGRGDMLYLPIDAPRATRLQGVLVTDPEIEALAQFWRGQGSPQYRTEVTAPRRDARGGGGEGEDDDADPLLRQAVDIVRRSDKASASLLQRRLRVGYARAARILDQMEDRGIVGPADGSRFREVLITPDGWGGEIGPGEDDE